MGGPEIAHLRQRMGQSVSGALHQIVAIAPRNGGIRLFKLEVRFEIGNAEQPQPAKNSNGAPFTLTSATSQRKKASKT